MNEWYIEPSGIGEQLGRKLATDSSLRSAVAIDLAQSFQAGDVGITEGMAYVAASLYNYWQLPLQPAAAFLADPTYSVNARRKAVRALKSYWATDEFRRAAGEALCSLVGRADGIESMRANSDTDLTDILNRDEIQFLEDIVFALEAAEEHGGPPASAIFALLPKQSVLTALAKKQFGIR